MIKYTYNSNTKKMKVGVSNESWSSTENRLKEFQRINLIIFLFINLTTSFGCLKELSHNISFGIDFLIMHSYLAT